MYGKSFVGVFGRTDVAAEGSEVKTVIEGGKGDALDVVRSNGASSRFAVIEVGCADFSSLRALKGTPTTCLHRPNASSPRASKDAQTGAPR